MQLQKWRKVANIFLSSSCGFEGRREGFDADACVLVDVDIYLTIADMQQRCRKCKKGSFWTCVSLAFYPLALPLSLLCTD